MKGCRPTGTTLGSPDAYLCPSGGQRGINHSADWYPPLFMSPEMSHIHAIKMHGPRFLLWNLFWGCMCDIMPSPPARRPLTREELLRTHVPTPMLSASEAPLPQRSPHVPFLGPNLAASASTNSSSRWTEVLWQGSRAGREHEVQGKLEFQIFNAKYLSFVPEIKVFKKFSLA